VKKKQKTNQYLGKLNQAVKNKPSNKMVVPSSMSTQQICSVPVVANFANDALNISLISLASYLIQRGLLIVSGDNPTPEQSIYSGVSYLGTAICSSARSGVVVAANLPRTADMLAMALKPTEVNFHGYGSVSYSWNNVVDPTGMGSVSNGGGIWRPVYVTTDTGLYNSPGIFYALGPSENAYARLLRLLNGVANSGGLEVVPAGTSEDIEGDASSYSRVYSYNGLDNGSLTGAFYKSIENEVTITCPMYANYISYDIQNDDQRVPKKLTVWSGDASIPMGWPLHETFCSPYNKIPIKFKVIDFEEIYAVLVLWMARAKETVSQNISFAAELSDPLPFTQQDFRIALRQALLTVFDTQYMTQFTGPIQATGTNFFSPFLVMGTTFGAKDFSRLKVPLLIKENLAALRARNVEIAGKSKLNCVTYMPVLGRYINDTPLVPEYNRVVNGVVVPTLLFQPVGAQSVINLIDGSIGGVNVDLNCSYYNDVLGDWNDAVDNVKVISAPVGPLGVDGGPAGWGVLFCTKVQKHTSETFSVQGKVPRMLKTLRFCENSERKLVRKGSQIVMDIPPASILNLRCTNILSARPFVLEEENFFNTIITPSIRFNPTNDILNTQMYQFEVDEVMNTRTGELTSPNIGTGMFSSLAQLAGICITGLAKDETDEYSMMMRRFLMHSEGGLLTDLLAGVAKQFFPGASGIIDTVASVSPF